MNRISIIGSTLAAIALGSAAQGASIFGSINFSSSAGGGALLENSLGDLTNTVGDAVAVRSWLLAKADTRSGSFLNVSIGQDVQFPQTWVFTPTTPTNPLWTIAGPDNFAFNLFASTVVLQSNFLLITGTGVLTGTGYDDTPATWQFTTQGTGTEGKFSWSSTTTAVPEPGALAFLGATLLGGCSLRRRKTASISPQNKQHENYISPPDVHHCLAGH